MHPAKKIALVAHDHMKRDLIEWAAFNRALLAKHLIYATGTTGATLESELGMPVRRLQSGPLGGDQQIGAKIVDNEIDFLIFFWDPLEPMPHDPDVKALLRMAVVWNIPIACNRATADFMVSSRLMDADYDRLVPDYDTYRRRRVDGFGERVAQAPDAQAPEAQAPDAGAPIDEPAPDEAAPGQPPEPERD